MHRPKSSPFLFCLDVLSMHPLAVMLRWVHRKRWPSQRRAALAASSRQQQQDSKGTLWGLKVPKASWVISHYGAVTEGSAVNTEIIWAMVNDSDCPGFWDDQGQIQLHQASVRPMNHSSSQQLGEWSRENRWRGMCRHTNKHVPPPLSPHHTGKWLLKVCRYRAPGVKGLLPSVANE